MSEISMKQFAHDIEAAVYKTTNMLILIRGEYPELWETLNEDHDGRAEEAIDVGTDCLEDVRRLKQWVERFDLQPE